MARTAPWHVTNDPVYHNNNACDAGTRLLTKATLGTGGKRLCATCDVLNRADSAAVTGGAERFGRFRRGV
ncbi:MAG: hypothetical protein FJX64_11395 [Alphaproteobacteria bacterium]|nr:hypothetical protein [Alphaproteobacteria bacterium]